MYRACVDRLVVDHTRLAIVPDDHGGNRHRLTTCNERLKAGARRNKRREEQSFSIPPGLPPSRLASAWGSTRADSCGSCPNISFVRVGPLILAPQRLAGSTGGTARTFSAPTDDSCSCPGCRQPARRPWTRACWFASRDTLFASRACTRRGRVRSALGIRSVSIPRPTSSTRWGSIGTSGPTRMIREIRG